MHLVTLCGIFGANSIFSPIGTRYLVITGSSLPLPKVNTNNNKQFHVVSTVKPR